MVSLFSENKFMALMVKIYATVQIKVLLPCSIFFFEVFYLFPDKGIFPDSGIVC